MDVLNKFFVSTLKFRIHVATACLSVALILPLILTIQFYTWAVNYVTSLVLIGFGLVLLPESIAQAKLVFKNSKLCVLAAAILLIVVIYWLIKPIPIFGLYRTWFYFAHVLFAFAFLVWLSEIRFDAVIFLFYVKLVSLLFVVIWLLYGYFTADILDWRQSVKGHPPIYRHLRHFNYDLAILIGLSVVAVVRGTLSRGGVFFLFALLGFATLWSGGRGQMLALAVFGVLLLLSRPFRLQVSQFKTAFLGFFCGVALVFLSGEAHIFLDSFHRSVARETLNGISSNRLGIWQRSLDALGEHWLLGFGPDAFIRLQVMSSNIVQPHSFIVQWLLEFGLVGTLALLLLLGTLMFQCASTIVSKQSTSEEAIVAALLVSIVVFAFFDGLFYHVIPSSLFLALALIFARRKAAAIKG